MDTSELDAAIASTEAELVKSRAAAEAAMEAILERVTQDLSAWLPNRIKKHVTTYSEITAKLAETGKLTEMKEKLEASTANLGDLVRKHIGRDEVWPHRGELDPHSHTTHTSYSYKPFENAEARSLPKSFLAAVAKVIHESAGPILHAYGYPMSRLRGLSDPTFGYFEPPNTWVPVFRTYGNELAKAERDAAKKREAVSAKAKTVAADAWDKA